MDAPAIQNPKDHQTFITHYNLNDLNYEIQLYIENEKLYPIVTQKLTAPGWNYWADYRPRHTFPHLPGSQRRTQGHHPHFGPEPAPAPVPCAAHRGHSALFPAQERL